MAHKRQLIRDSLLAMLTNNTDAGANVVANRVTPFWEAELPMIAIYYGSEGAERRAANSQQSIRTLSLLIEIIAEGDDTLDTTLDTISDQVEKIIAANYSLSGKALSCTISNTEPSLDESGERVIGRLKLNFETKYID